MDLKAMIKERIAELQKKLYTHPDPKSVQVQIDQNRKLLEDMEAKK